MIELQPQEYHDAVIGNFGDRDIAKQTETGMTNPTSDAFDTDSIQLQEHSTIDENLDNASIKSDKVKLI